MPDFDSPWKEAMDRYFDPFLAFFFPKIHALLDWSSDHESLDSDLRKLAADAGTGVRYIDKLVKAARARSRDKRLVHVEVQCQKEEGFAHRLHVYNYRCEDVHSHPVLTLVVLGDEDPDWRPAEYVFEEEGCERILRWPLVKLLDHAGRINELEAGPHLFGWMVVAHLLAQQTPTDIPARKAGKLRLLRGLYSRNLEAEDVRQWSRYLDWLLPLPEAEEDDVDRQILQAEKEKQMPFVTSFERFGFKRGRQEGLDEGRKEGRLAGLHRTIEVALEIRFGAEGLALMPAVREKSDLALLEQLVQAVKSASLDDVRKLLA
jgi:hypothetical protein